MYSERKRHDCLGITYILHSSSTALLLLILFTTSRTRLLEPRGSLVIFMCATITGRLEGLSVSLKTSNIRESFISTANMYHWHICIPNEDGSQANISWIFQRRRLCDTKATRILFFVIKSHIANVACCGNNLAFIAKWTRKAFGESVNDVKLFLVWRTLSDEILMHNESSKSRH